MLRLCDIITRDVVRFVPDTELLHALHILTSRGISGAQVMEPGGWAVGMLSHRDCLRAAIDGTYYREWDGPVSAAMRLDVESLPPDLDLLSAARLFADRPYSGFPALEADRLVGLVSRSDLLRALTVSWRT